MSAIVIICILFVCNVCIFKKPLENSVCFVNFLMFFFLYHGIVPLLCFLECYFELNDRAIQNIMQDNVK